MIEAGTLVAAGTLTQGTRRSEPTGGEPSAFSVHYGANPEVMAELLPDLGATHVWDTDATVAPSEFEQKGNEFTIRAYSPLFMDVGPSDLPPRVWGYDNASESLPGSPVCTVAATGGCGSAAAFGEFGDSASLGPACPVVRIAIGVVHGGDERAFCVANHSGAWLPTTSGMLRQQRPFSVRTLRVSQRKTETVATATRCSVVI